MGSNASRAEAGALLFGSDEIAENKMRNCRSTRGAARQSLLRHTFSLLKNQLAGVFMHIESISYNENFTSRKIHAQKKSARIPSKHIIRTSKQSGENSILLYFAGLFSAFGLSKPLNTLIGKLR